MHLMLSMNSVPSSPLDFLKKSRKHSISSASGTFDSSAHSSVLGDSFASAGGGLALKDATDKPVIRQIRHSGTKLSSEVRDRIAKYHDRAVLQITGSEIATLLKQQQGVENSIARIEDRFASNMNRIQTEDQLAQLRDERRTTKAVTVEESDDDDNDSLDKSLAKFWAREQRKSVHYVTSNLHHLVLVGEEDNIMTYAGYQFTQGMPESNYMVVSSHTMKPCSA